MGARTDSVAGAIAVGLIAAGIGACSVNRDARSDRPANGDVAVAGGARSMALDSTDCAPAGGRGDKSRVGVRLCDGGGGGAPPPRPTDPTTPPAGGFAYDIVYHERYESEKRDLAFDVTYRASLAPDAAPDAVDQLVGQGRYEGGRDGLRRELHQSASRTAGRTGVRQAQGVGGVADHRTGEVVEDKQMSFVLATTDWKILPVAGVAITDEEREAAAGSGTVAELLFPLTGPVTQHHERKLFNQTKCDGNIMRTVDITIIERSLGAPVATRRR